MLTPLSRRRFFGLTAAAAVPALAGYRVGADARVHPSSDTAASPAAELPPPAASARQALKLGIASYSMREFSLDDALAMTKRLGVKYMTFKDVHVPRTETPDQTRARRAKIEAAGITIMGGGTITIPNDAAQIRKEFDYARNAGVPLIYVDPFPAALDTIEKMAKEYDIRVAIHNHGPEDTRWPRPQDAYAAVKSRDRRLGLCIDIGHTTRTGTDPVAACRECRDRLYDLHVKDLADRTVKDSDVEVGRGVMDIPALFRTLVEIGYQGQVGLEYEIHPTDPFPGMTESLAYMRGVLAGIG